MNAFLIFVLSSFWNTLIFSLQIQKKLQIIVIIAKNKQRKKCTQEHLRNALKSLLLQKNAVKFPRPKQFKYTPAKEQKT